MAATSHHGTARNVKGGVPLGAGPACDTFPIVGVGASAGGLGALTRLLHALSAHAGIALLLVQHLDPTQESMLAEILGRASDMPVLEAAQGMLVEPDHVYVIPVNKTMHVSRGSIALEERPKPPALTLPIDTLLRSLAAECGIRSIGVVLSGTGSDGVSGLTAIKAAGGLTFGQDPATAEYDGMPRAAETAGVVDEVLDIEDLARRLIQLGAQARLKEPIPVAGSSAPIDDESFAAILTLVKEATRLDLSSYRKTTLVRRISRRMLLEGVETMKDYVHLLREDPPRSRRSTAMFSST